jgi:hypothetical protein
MGSQNLYVARLAGHLLIRPGDLFTGIGPPSSRGSTHSALDEQRAHADSIDARVKAQAEELGEQPGEAEPTDTPRVS